MSATDFHPDLRLARFLPRATVGPRSLRLARAMTSLAGKATRTGAVTVRLDLDVSVRLTRPASPAAAPLPALLWMHGGGMVFGDARGEDLVCRRFADELGALVVAVEYRLAPEHPYPAPLEDCWTALRWLAALPDVDRARIAVGGVSAGGGLAAGLALLTRERGGPPLALQLLAYPMLDDRTTSRRDLDTRHLRLWSPRNNRFGWKSYLGSLSGSDVPMAAAPGRCEDLTGLAPAWVGVGTNDLFHDEDLAYAQALRAAGSGSEVCVVPGGYHAFDLVQPRAEVSRDFHHQQIVALRQAFSSQVA